MTTKQLLDQKGCDIQSVRNHLETILKSWKSIAELQTTGYNSDMDCEIWEWVEKDELILAIENVDEMMQQTQQLKQLLFKKLVEFHLQDEFFME